MTVDQLIAELEKAPLEYDVIVTTGYTDLLDITDVYINHSIRTVFIEAVE